MEKNTSTAKCKFCEKAFIENNVAYVVAKVIVNKDGETKELKRGVVYHHWCWEKFAGEDYSL